MPSSTMPAPSRLSVTELTGPPPALLEPPVIKETQSICGLAFQSLQRVLWEHAIFLGAENFI